MHIKPVHVNNRGVYRKLRSGALNEGSSNNNKRRCFYTPPAAKPATRKDVLGEADETLSLLQQLQLQQVAAPSHAVLAFLHIHDTLQLEPPAGDSDRVGTSPVRGPLSHLRPAWPILLCRALSCWASTTLFVPSFPPWDGLAPVS